MGRTQSVCNGGLACSVLVGNAGSGDWVFTQIMKRMTAVGFLSFMPLRTRMQLRALTIRNLTGGILALCVAKGRYRLSDQNKSLR